MCKCSPNVRTPFCGKPVCTPPEQLLGDKLKELREKAMADRLQAEKSMYAYACECEIGDERIWAFEAYERIRTATRRDDLWPG